MNVKSFSSEYWKIRSELKNAQLDRSTGLNVENTSLDEISDLRMSFQQHSMDR